MLRAVLCLFYSSIAMLVFSIFVKVFIHFEKPRRNEEYYKAWKKILPKCFLAGILGIIGSSMILMLLWY